MKKNVIIYVPQQVTSVVELYNKHLKNAYKSQDEYLIFIQKDILDNLKNSEDYFEKTISFMKEWDLPYYFNPYYTYFNKVLPDMTNTPNPRIELTIKEYGTINIVNQICHGLLILDINKLKSFNFLFDTNYPVLYYLQDMVQKCYEKNLWISNCWFIDRYKSYEDLKEIKLQGYMFDGKRFQEEKAKYQKLNIQYHNVQEFIQKLKQKRGIK